jgi:hypothetical protein
MATLLSVGDFVEKEFWTMLDPISVLPNSDNLLDYDDDPVNNYLKEGDTKYRKFVSEFGVEEANLTTPITANVKCKLIAWVGYCICRDAQEGKGIPLYSDVQEDKIDWWKIKKQDYYAEYNSCKINASDLGTVEDGGRFTMAIGKVKRTS